MNIQLFMLYLINWLPWQHIISNIELNFNEKAYNLISLF